MGEAKRRGTFEQRRVQAQIKRAVLFAAMPPVQERPVAAMPSFRLRNTAIMMAAFGMGQGVFIIRQNKNKTGKEPA